MGKEFDGQTYVKHLLGKDAPTLQGIEAHAHNTLRATIVEMGQAQAQASAMEKEIQRLQAQLEQLNVMLQTKAGEVSGLADLLCTAEAERRGEVFNKGQVQQPPQKQVAAS